MLRYTFLFPLLFTLCFAAHSQAGKASRALWSAVELSKENSPTANPDDAVGLTLDASEFNRLRANRPQKTLMVLPFPEGDQFLRLQQFEVRSDAFEVATTGPEGFRYVPAKSRIVTYEVLGDVSGTVILFKDHVLASLNVNGRRWELNRRKDDVHALFPVDASSDDRTFTCGVEDQLELPAPQDPSASQARSSNLLECVEVGMEIDEFTFQSLGSNLDDAVDWALAILASVDQIYRNELNDLVTLDARFIHVWMSPDPYASVTNDGGGILGAFNSEWNNNPNFNSIPLDLKHLMTTRTNIGTGGIAYLNGLCNSYNAGVSGNLTTSTNYNINTYAWNLDVVSHELGHNCGANHTHWCGWPGGPIDNCGSLEGDCGGYTNNPTGQLGTIMSYCHAIAGGSKTLTFHPLVEDNALIPTFNSASCIGTCGTPVVESTNVQCGDSQACNYTPGDTGTDGCIYAGPCADCGTDGGITNGVEVNEFTASLAGTSGSTLVFAASGTAYTIDITLDFSNPQSSGSWPGDLLLALCAPGGDCLQIGGYNVDAGFPSAGPWPSAWNTSSPGVYSASIDLSSLQPAGNGDWNLQLINGWNTSGVVNYDADIEIFGLCPNLSTEPGCTDPEACNFSPSANLDDGTCLYADALGECGGPCTSDDNGNGICDDEEACGNAACGVGTWWDESAGMCRSTLLNCPGDVDFDGLVNVTDALNVLSGFGVDCGEPVTAQANCPSAPCCDADACGTGTVWDSDAQKCVSSLIECPGDVDMDGAVTVSDVLDVLSMFGETCE